MDPAKNPLQYMEALKDITGGAPDGIFSTMFCQVLFAQQAAINTLQSQLIKIGNAIYGGERFNADGSDKNATQPGFWLGANGVLKAVGAEFSGLVNATSGNFDNITISGDSLFSGAIISGPLVLLDDTPYSGLYTYQSGTDATTIYNGAKNLLGTIDGRTFSVEGSYGNEAITRMGYRWRNGPGGSYYGHYIDAYYQDGTSAEIAHRWSEKDKTNISAVLTFRYISGGKTFKLLDLPSQQGGPAGTVYRIGNQLMIN
jgi:hypothetical protein